MDSGSVMAEADPQAAVLTKLASIFVPSLTVEDIQTGLTIFIALLPKSAPLRPVHRF